MHKKVKKHIPRILFFKSVAGLVFGLSTVVTSGCGKLCGRYAVKEGQPYSQETLNEHSPTPLNNGHSINESDNDGKTDLHIAVENNDIDRVKFLINDPRIDVNQPDKYGNAPLHVATTKNYVDVVEALLSDDRTLVNKKNDHGETALYIALDEGYTEIVQLLLADKRTEYEKVCSICPEPICHNSNDLYITRCSHFFHKQCLKQWEDHQSNNNKICPNCRRAIKAV